MVTAAFPRPTTTLVGRDIELATLLVHLRGGARLATLTGLGGMGKTRLAVEACLALGNERRIAYCHAARAEGLEALVWAIATALGVSPARDLVRVDPLHALALVTQLEPPHVIVLDDFEHLAEQAAAAVERWLFLSPPTVLVVTSRRTLGAPSEHVVPVEPLGIADASQLLLARARQLSPNWGADDSQGVRQLATLLEGLPLAIELAAAQARAGGPAALRRLWRARRTDPRHTSRDIAVRWSWEHLEPAARHDLTALATIVTAFDLELAAAALECSPDDAIVRVAALVHDSLVASSSGATPYRLLDTVREFVIAQGEPAIFARASNALTRAVIERMTPILSRQIPIVTTLNNRLAADYGTLEAIVRRGLEAPAEALDAAYSAAMILVVAVRLGDPHVPPFELLARLCVDVDGAHIDLHRRIAYADELVLTTDGLSRPLATRVFERLTTWLAASDDSDHCTHARWRLAASLARSWRFREVSELLQRLAEPAAGDLRSTMFAMFIRLMVAQKLGTLTPDAAELGVYDRLIDSVANSGRLEWGVAIVNQAYFAAQLARPRVVLALRNMLTRIDQLGLVLERGYLARELARAEIDQGQLAVGIARFIEVLGGDCLMFGAERLETRLELAAAYIEACDLERAGASLAEVAPWVATSPFVAAYYVTLAHAVSWLDGDEARLGGPASFIPTDTTEDVGFAVWASLGTNALEGACHAAQVVAPINARVRQALRLANALQAINAGRGFAVARDCGSFRVAAGWVDLRKRPLLGALLNAIVDAAAGDHSATIDKERLAAHLWPGVRMEPATRDNRLHVTLASLRKLGLGAWIVHRDGGFGLDPACALVRIDPRALP